MRKSLKTGLVLAGMGLALLAGSCAPASEDIPLIGENTLVELLIDFHLVEARLHEGHQVPIGVRDSIFIVHNVDSIRYAETLRYYSNKPERYADVYNRVLERMNTERTPLPLQ